MFWIFPNRVFQQQYSISKITQLSNPVRRNSLEIHPNPLESTADNISNHCDNYYSFSKPFFLYGWLTRRAPPSGGKIGKFLIFLVILLKILFITGETMMAQKDCCILKWHRDCVLRIPFFCVDVSFIVNWPPKKHLIFCFNVTNLEYHP